MSGIKVDRDKFARALCWTMNPCSSMVAEIMDGASTERYPIRMKNKLLRDQIYQAADHMISLLERGELEIDV